MLSSLLKKPFSQPVQEVLDPESVKSEASKAIPIRNMSTNSPTCMDEEEFRPEGYRAYQTRTSRANTLTDLEAYMNALKKDAVSNASLIVAPLKDPSLQQAESAKEEDKDEDDEAERAFTSVSSAPAETDLLFDMDFSSSEEDDSVVEENSSECVDCDPSQGMTPRATKKEMLFSTSQQLVRPNHRLSIGNSLDNK